LENWSKSGEKADGYADSKRTGVAPRHDVFIGRLSVRGRFVLFGALRGSRAGITEALA
jgi:hypothetical protein